jgi:DNA-binding NarL/FixJ family response regulator
MIRAIVIDDEPYILEEICDLLEATNCISVEQRYLNPLESLKEFSNICPDVAFIDVSMPEIEGIALAKKFREIQPTVEIVFITAWRQYAVDAFEVNALDYLVKPIRQERFDQMINRIKEQFSHRQKDSREESLLTDREEEVLKLVAEGHTRTEIAEKLNVSVSTVKRHVESIFAKLEVNNKISAVKKAETLHYI